MKTKPHHLRLMLPRAALLVVALLAGQVRMAYSANIVFVSDANDPAGTAANTFSGFFPASPGFTDSGFVTLLQNAGHTVIRYNQPNAQGTPLPAAEIIALNTNDLIIMSRAVNSGALQVGQGNQWNTNIIKPLIDMSSFHARLSRLGWFSANEAGDATPAPLGAVVTGDPVRDAVVDYLFADVTMNGTNTALPYDELLDRNSTPVLGVPVPGGISYATTTYVREDSTAASPVINRATVIAGFPAGTPVRTNNVPPDVLAGYRLFFSAGSRESSIQPAAIPQYTGREILSPVGEIVFLRAVALALNNGIPPAIDPLAPVAIVTPPADVTVVENGSATFAATASGSGPRTLQWQRDTGDGVTFTNVPDAGTVFFKTELKLPLVTSADNNAKFILVASNPINSVTSSVVTLTVTEDTTPPAPLSAASVDGNVIGIRFSEALDRESAEFQFNYSVSSGGLDSSPSVVTLRADGRTISLQMPGPVDATFTVTVSAVKDLAQNEMPTAVTIGGANLGLGGVEVGPGNPAGGSFASDIGAIEITSGGTNVLGNADQFAFSRKTVTGDFDVRVRVRGIRAPERLESYAKALLAARETDAAGSAGVLVFATTATPGDDSVGTTIRNATGAQAAALGNVLVPGGIPSAWLRIKRSGNDFTTYRSTDGTAWTAFGTTNLPLSSTMQVGLGANAHRNGRSVIATFSDFTIIQAPNQPTILNPTYAGGSFSGSFQTQNGFSYRVVYKDDLSAATWSLLTTIPGNGGIQPFTDLTPSPNQRFYRVEILP